MARPLEEKSFCTALNSQEYICFQRTYHLDASRNFPPFTATNVSAYRLKSMLSQSHVLTIKFAALASNESGRCNSVLRFGVIHRTEAPMTYVNRVQARTMAMRRAPKQMLSRCRVTALSNAFLASRLESSYGRSRHHAPTAPATEHCRTPAAMKLVQISARTKGAMTLRLSLLPEQPRTTSPPQSHA